VDEAAAFVQALRPDGSPRQAITVSFRSHPAILAFVNGVFAEIACADPRRDGFRYGESDRVPIDVGADPFVRPEPTAAGGAAPGAAPAHHDSPVLSFIPGPTRRDRADPAPDDVA